MTFEMFHIRNYSKFLADIDSLGSSMFFKLLFPYFLKFSLFENNFCTFPILAVTTYAHHYPYAYGFPYVHVKPAEKEEEPERKKRDAESDPEAEADPEAWYYNHYGYGGYGHRYYGHRYGGYYGHPYGGYGYYWG